MAEENLVAEAYLAIRASADRLSGDMAKIRDSALAACGAMGRTASTIFSAGLGNMAGGVGTLGNSITGLGAKIAATAALFYGAGAAFAKNFLAQAEEAEQIQARLAGLIKATGGAAGYTANQLNQMAAEFAKFGTASKGEILQAQTALLKFSEVRGDQFGKTMTAGMDMAALTGKSLTEVIMSLGMAMENPEMGMRRLRHEGIMLGDDVQKSVKRAFDSGDIVAAQELLLEAINKHFAGGMEAMSHTMKARMAHVWEEFGDVSKAAGAQLFPVLEQMIPHLEHLAAVLGQNTSILATFAATAGAGIGHVIDGVTHLVEAWSRVPVEVQKSIAHAAGLAAAFGLATTVLPRVLGLVGSLTGLGGAFGPMLRTVTGLGGAFGRVAASLGPLGGSLASLAGHFGGLIGTLGAPLVSLAGTLGSTVGTLVGQFGGLVSGVLGKVGSLVPAFTGAVGEVVGVFGTIFGTLGGYVGTAMGLVGGFLGDVLGKVAGLVPVLTGVFEKLGGTIKSAVLGPLGPLVDILGLLAGAAFLDMMREPGFGDLMKDSLKDLKNLFADLMKQGAEFGRLLMHELQPVFAILKPLITEMFQQLGPTLRVLIGLVGEFAVNLLQAAVPAFTTLAQVASEVMRGIVGWLGNNKAELTRWGRALGEIFGNLLTMTVQLGKSFYDLGVELLAFLSKVTGFKLTDIGDVLDAFSAFTTDFHRTTLPTLAAAFDVLGATIKHGIAKATDQMVTAFEEMLARAAGGAAAVAAAISGQDFVTQIAIGAAAEDAVRKNLNVGQEGAAVGKARGELKEAQEHFDKVWKDVLAIQADVRAQHQAGRWMAGHQDAVNAIGLNMAGIGGMLNPMAALAPQAAAVMKGGGDPVGAAALVGNLFGPLGMGGGFGALMGDLGQGLGLKGPAGGLAPPPREDHEKNKVDKMGYEALHDAIQKSIVADPAVMVQKQIRDKVADVAREAAKQAVGVAALEKQLKEIVKRLPVVGWGK